MTTFEELEKLQAKLKAADISEIIRPPPKKVVKYVKLDDLISSKPRTIEVRAGLSKEEFAHVLALLKSGGEQLKRGPKLLDLDIRLLITLQWFSLIRHTSK